MNRKQRNINVEILRILAMVMVVALHVTGHGMGEVAFENKMYFPALLINSLGYCAVDTFLFISAYYLSEQEFRWKRILKIWFQTAFYALVIVLLCMVSGVVAVVPMDIIKAILPVAFREYGFVTAYIGMCLMAPVLNMLLQKLTQNEHRILLAVLFMLLSIYPMFTMWQIIFFQEGNCFGIALVIYCLASYMKKYGKDRSAKTYFKWYFGACAFQFLVGIVLGIGTHVVLGRNLGEGILMHYNSPTVLLATWGISMGFIGMKKQIKNPVMQKGILLIASATFGVFLIHEHPVIRDFLWENWRGIVGDSINVITVTVSIIVIFMACTILDLLRQLLFKIAHISSLENRLGNKLDAIMEKICARIWVTEEKL